ncbi:MAG TPA: flagellar protein FlaG [Caulobacteraceae bacterium]|jgi:flagellar protein FlaG|nr:flagellar protein FlaG [Caulobacteraceae bacterium]
MSNTAPISGTTPDVAPAQPAPATTPAATGASQAPSTQLDAQADLRLVIEEDKASGSYVYKTVDPITGKVISQMPREQLLKMREADDYKPGSIVDSRS